MQLDTWRDAIFFGSAVREIRYGLYLWRGALDLVCEARFCSEAIRVWWREAVRKKEESAVLRSGRTKKRSEARCFEVGR